MTRLKKERKKRKEIVMLTGGGVNGVKLSPPSNETSRRVLNVVSFEVEH